MQLSQEAACNYFDYSLKNLIFFRQHHKVWFLNTFFIESGFPVNLIIKSFDSRIVGSINVDFYLPCKLCLLIHCLKM